MRVRGKGVVGINVVDVVDDHVLQKVERAQRIGTVRIESCIN